MAINPKAFFGGKNPADGAAEARKRVEKMHAAKCEVEQLYLADAAQLAQEEAHAGGVAFQAHLDGGADISGQVALLTRLRGHLEVLAGSVEHGRRQHEAAILEFIQAEAAAKLAEAAPLREEADKLEKQAEPLLAKLHEIQGVDYVPAKPEPGEQMRLEHGAVQALQQVVVTIPKSEFLRRQADALERQAADMARRQVVKAGTVTGSREEVLQAIQGDAYRVVPAMADVLTWMAEGEAAERARRVRERDRWGEAMAPADEAPFQYELAWRDGQLARASSKVSTAALVAA